MENFGLIELASAKTTVAPGWAYVPDRTANSAATIQTTGRKRAAARGKGLSLSDQTAREEAKIRKELEALDREGSRDVVIPVPAKGRAAQNKSTPNVRKILQSMKTFANHLDDFEAMQTQGGDRIPKPGTLGSSVDIVMGETGTPVLTPLAPSSEDVEMTGGDEQSKDEKPQELKINGVNDVEKLLAPRVPDTPSDAELRTLLAAPPLNYRQARATWTAEAARYPVRVFCSVCGYWGKFAA
ncbi:unnamed protein product [Parascedosporium putredinis]|uniref:Uncharacterized protein n=1 Tax=Parascedosporium putredinis TaxID=1442378 RepID=A0A9P1H5K0_9PEZI|nr:unnamed protein product [Parascedosporium putredinis]CAI7998010.1 unnamed protein product [Parascedosporium putredinis]